MTTAHRAAMAALALAFAALPPLFAQSFAPSFSRPSRAMPPESLQSLLVTIESRSGPLATADLATWRNAAHTATTDAKGVRRAIELLGTDEGLVSSAPDPRFIAAQLARISQDVPSLARAVAEIPSIPGRDSALVCARQLAALADAFDRERASLSQVSMFAEGNIRGVATGTSQASSATGALGIRLESSRYVWTASVNVASTLDTLRSGFGANILQIGVGSGGAVFLTDVRIRAGAISGLHLSVGSSRTVWGLQPTPLSATVLGGGVGFYRDVLHGQIQDNDVGLSFEGGLGVRYLSGDVRDADRSVDTLLNGDGRRTFKGGYISSQIRFGSIVALAQLSWYSGHVRSLSRVQLVAGFSVQAPIFKGRL